jgi:protein-S-isoprenylcysteine O-methyltransferase Ste14
LALDLAQTLRKRRVSDWLGCFGHLAIAVVMIVQAPTLTLFLMPAIIHMVFAGGSFLIRDRPKRLEQNLMGRVVSYAGGFGVFAFVQFASFVRPDWLTVTSNPILGLTGIAFGIAGVLLEIWAVWHLKFAFATEPAARRLVTTGPYRFARHPIYTGGCLAYLGLFLTRPTVAIAVVLLGWAFCVRMRMQYEEAILESAFPSYADYRRRVGAIGTWPSPGRDSIQNNRAAA